MLKKLTIMLFLILNLLVTGCKKNDSKENTTTDNDITDNDTTGTKYQCNGLCLTIKLKK